MKKKTEKYFPLTRQRKAILEYLRKVKTHPSADEIFEVVRKNLPRISLGTVYRNLEKMCKKGLIRKIEIADTKKRFDATVDNHYHIRCDICGRVDDLHGARFMDLENISNKLRGYKIIGFSIELTGICPRCLKSKKIRNKNY
mgnify:CR=1 FL=1